MKKILIVEDEFIEAKNLERLLRNAGFEVCGIARSVDAANSIIAATPPDFVLVDIFLKGELTGIELAHQLRSRNIPFLYLSANTNKTTLDAAKETRPYGFLVKPFREKDVLIMLEIAMYQHSNGLDTLLRNQGADNTAVTRKAINEQRPIEDIIGQSEELSEVIRHLRIVAPTETSALILGESGTGKEKIARAVHELSRRKDQPFVKVNCAALPFSLIESILFGHEKGAFTGAIARSIGKFEQAQHGTLFLDEIGEMPLDVQVKLLRALQEKEIERVGGKDTIQVDVRIVAATNRDLEKEMLEGRFRMDLYYRLNVFPLHLPPLRQRKKDIPQLANYFIAKFCRAENKPIFAPTPSVLQRLLSYEWPGNIRELENIMKRLVLVDPDQHPEMIQQAFARAKTRPGIKEQEDNQETDAKNREIKTWDEYQRDYLLFVLKKCNGKISGENGAAKFLNLPASTLESKMKKLGIKKQHYTDFP